MTRELFSTKCVVSVAVGFVLLLCSAAANATVLFQDDFQSDTAGTTLSGGDLDPVIGAGDVGGSWVIREPGDGWIRVINDTVPGNNTAGSDNYTEIIRGNSASSDSFLYATDWNATDTLNQVIQLDYSLWQQPGGDNTLMLIEAPPNNNVNFPSASTAIIFEDLDTEIPDEEWVSVSILANLDSSATQLGIPAQTYTVSINGGTPVSHAFYSAHNQIESIAWFEGANNSEEYVDNVVLQTIPEPSALLLAGLGVVAVGSTCRRRNHN